jgi:hypothetical protein
MEEDKLGFDGSPQGLRQLTAKVTGDVLRKKNQRSAAAAHFGVPVEQVDDQMIEMFTSLNESGA